MCAHIIVGSPGIVPGRYAHTLNPLDRTPLRPYRSLLPDRVPSDPQLTFPHRFLILCLAVDHRVANECVEQSLFVNHLLTPPVFCCKTSFPVSTPQILLNHLNMDLPSPQENTTALSFFRDGQLRSLFVLKDGQLHSGTAHFIIIFHFIILQVLS